MTAARVLSVLLVALAVAGAATRAAAQDRSPIGESGAWDLERAFVELERLRAEIVTLRSLAGVQAALLAWNLERAESGAGPALLPARLCAERELGRWCRTLPATFGADAAEGGGQRQGEDGER